MEIKLTGALRSAVGDLDKINIYAETIRELMMKLTDLYPSISPHMDTGIAVAINGEIYRDNWDVKIPDDAEVFLMPRIPGG